MTGCMPHILLASPLTELNVHVRAHQNIRPVHQHNFHNTFFQFSLRLLLEFVTAPVSGNALYFDDANCHVTSLT